MASDNKEQIGSISKRARMSQESEACLKEDSKNAERALKRLNAGEDLSREDIKTIDEKRTLIKAVKSKNLKMVKNFLDHGASIDIQDGKGETPLFYACRDGHYKIAVELIERGADVNMKNFIGESILSVAYHERKTEIFYTLLTYGAKVHKVIFELTTMQGNTQLVQIMLDHGAELKDFNGLQQIVVRGHLDVLKLLIKHGVDLNRRSRFLAAVPLYYAVLWEHIEIVSELLKNGANPHLPNRDGNTPIHTATKFPCSMKVFLNLGVSLDLNMRNNNRETVLENALTKGWKDTAKMILHFNHHN